MKAAAFASKLKQGIADVSTKRGEALGRRRLLSAGGWLYITSTCPLLQTPIHCRWTAQAVQMRKEMCTAPIHPRMSCMDLSLPSTCQSFFYFLLGGFLLKEERIWSHFAPRTATHQLPQLRCSFSGKANLNADNFAPIPLIFLQFFQMGERK